MVTCVALIGERKGGRYWAGALCAVRSDTQEAANLAIPDTLDFGGGPGSFLNAGIGTTYIGRFPNDLSKVWWNSGSTFRPVFGL